MTLRGTAFCAFSTLLLSATAFAQSALQSGAPVQINLPAQNFVSNYFIDVDANAKQLTFNVSTGSGADLDLFVRYGTPFPTAGDANFLADEVGDAAIYLLSDMSRGVTAEILHVDAGYNIVGRKHPDAPDIDITVPKE